MNKINNILKKRALILDGATGTELQKAGMPSGVCPEIWALKNPDVIESIHKGYVNAGSDIIYACTFGANSVKLAEYGRFSVFKINKKLAELAKACAGKKALVAGGLAPTGRFIQPFGDLDFESAVKIYKEQARGLLAGGVDLFVIETMMDI